MEEIFGCGKKDNFTAPIRQGLYICFTVVAIKKSTFTRLLYSGPRDIAVFMLKLGINCSILDLLPMIITIYHLEGLLFSNRKTTGELDQCDSRVPYTDIPS